MATSTPVSPVDFWRGQQKIFEGLFPPGWFDTPKDHPAFHRWALCNRILNGERIPLHAIASAVLDGLVLVGTTHGDTQRMEPGTLAAYGDASVQKKILSRIEDPSSYEDLMAELTQASWYITHGAEVTPYEEKGADLKVVWPHVDRALCVECKHLRSTRLSRIKKDIQEAGKQIKALDQNAYGVAVLDLGAVVELERVEGDELPRSILRAFENAKRAVQGKINSHVGLVLLVWDDYRQFGGYVEYRRNLLRVTHRNAILPIPRDFPIFRGYTVQLMT